MGSRDKIINSNPLQMYNLNHEIDYIDIKADCFWKKINRKLIIIILFIWQ